ncbi:hypothetical protein V6Z11_D06G074500 [Gossypium hirsutum]
MASSIRPSLSSFRFSGGVSTSRFGLSLSPLRLPPHLHFSHLTSTVPQSHFFGLKASKLLKTAGTSVGMRPVGNVVHASTATAQETALEWVKKDKRRMLHVVYRVGDLDRTIKFYTECLGMKLLRKRDIPEERYTNQGFKLRSRSRFRSHCVYRGCGHNGCYCGHCRLPRLWSL